MNSLYTSKDRQHLLLTYRIEAIIMWSKLCKKIYEHGYFGSIGSGVKFQFFGTHFTSTSRISMRVGAFDSSTLPLCGKNMELVYGTSNLFFWDTKVEVFVKFWVFKMANSRNFWSQKFQKKKLFSKMFQNGMGPWKIFQNVFCIISLDSNEHFPYA